MPALNVWQPQHRQPDVTPQLSEAVTSTESSKDRFTQFSFSPQQPNSSSMEFADDEKKKKVEVIHEALKQFIEQRRNGIDEMKQEQVDEETQLLSRLLSKLDSIESDSGREVHLPSEPSRNEERECGKREVGVDKIAKELRALRWQNRITHCLLLATISITTFWQLSEVSLLIKVRETFSHPLKAVGDMIQGTLKGQNKKQHLDEAPLLPHIDVSNLPHLEVPSLNLNLNSLED